MEINKKILIGIGILAAIAAIVLLSGCVEEKSTTNCSTKNITLCNISCDTDFDCRGTCCGCINKNEDCQTESGGGLFNPHISVVCDMTGECKCVNGKCESSGGTKISLIIPDATKNHTIKIHCKDGTTEILTMGNENYNEILFESIKLFNSANKYVDLIVPEEIKTGSISENYVELIFSNPVNISIERGEVSVDKFVIKLSGEYKDFIFMYNGKYWDTRNPDISTSTLESLTGCVEEPIIPLGGNGCITFDAEGIVSNLKEINNTLFFDFKATNYHVHAELEGEIFKISCKKPDYDYELNEGDEITIKSYIALRQDRYTEVDAITCLLPKVTLDASNFSVISANNQFAFDLYSEFKDDEGNIFFSPYSISTALSMTYEGARGKTADEMQSVLHFPKDNTTRRIEFSKIINQINKKDKKYQLNTANALWAQKNYKFSEEYFNTIEQYYGGKVTNLDFVKDTENSRIIINNWIENQTNNKIKDLIPQGVLNDMTRLVLTNVIYFKGNWAKQFDKKDTREANFKVNSEKTIKVQMMSLTDKEFNYTETENLQILELPYEDNELSMLILLPKGEDLQTMEKSLDAEKLNGLKNNLREQEVNVYIPKFTFETKYFMGDTLKEMGMPTAFSMAADFSGMDGTKNLFISSVIHQGFIEVNEEGTEAAAATAVVINYKLIAPAEIPTFKADHPFIFLIQEKGTGSILFLGKVVDPTQ